MTNEVSPNKQLYLSKEELFTKFSSLPRLKFVTINPNKGIKDMPKTRVGKWFDLLKRCSNNFFIVREHTNGIHFHALVSILDGAEIKPQRGIHFDIKDVSKPFKGMPDKMNELTHLVCELGLSPEEAESVMSIRNDKAKARSKIAKPIASARKADDISRIINYMLKDGPEKPFEDYILWIDCKYESIYQSPWVPPS